MKFMHTVELLTGSKMNGSALMTAADVYTKAQADGQYALISDISINHYTKSNLQTSGQASVHWNNITNKPSYDNYIYWTAKVNGESVGHNVGSGSVFDVRGSGATSVSRSGGVITISSQNDNNYTSSLTGVGNGTLTLHRVGMSSLTLDLAHTHSTAQVDGLTAALDAKQSVAAAATAMATHKAEDAPHAYGNKFQFAYNPTFGTLDLQVIT